MAQSKELEVGDGDFEIFWVISSCWHAAAQIMLIIVIILRLITNLSETFMDI